MPSPRVHRQDRHDRRRLSSDFKLGHVVVVLRLCQLLTKALLAVLVLEGPVPDFAVAAPDYPIR